MKKFLLTTALAFALPVSAHAVTLVSIGDDIFEEQELAVGGTAGFNFQATSDLRITMFSVSGQGQSSGVDVADVSYTVLVGGNAILGPAAFASVTPFASLGVGGSDLPDLVLSENEILTVFFQDGIVAPVDVDVAFSVAPIPLPAAGGMLLTGLAVAGFAASRRKKKQAS